MTGTGIQEDPYVVGSWEEFEQAASIGTHIKLGNDIYAPDTATNLDMNNVDSLDGDDHAIYNLYIASGYGLRWGSAGGYISRSPIIKNISFLNVNSQGGGLIYTKIYDYYITKINNVVISGFFSGGDIIHIGNRDGSDKGNISSVGFSVNTSLSTLKLVAFDGYGQYTNCSFINAKINYGNVEIAADSTPFKVTSLGNSKIELNFPTDGNIINMPRVSNCVIIGTGAGVKVVESPTITVVEDTLPLDPTSSANVIPVTTAQMQNASYLADLGFPIGVE